MDLDLLDLYGRASQWTLDRVQGATDQLDAPTPCEEWDVRTLLDHMLDTQHYFIDSARGQDAKLPDPTPPRLIDDDPVGDFQRTRSEMLETFGEPGVLEKTGPALGIAFTDQLVHGWDLAVATGQDTAMPSGLAEAAYQMVHGRFTDDQRTGMFKPELQVGAHAAAQDRLLGYLGRDPAV